jgi:hypothetical protein
VFSIKEKFLPMQVENKPYDRGSENAFILGSMVCTVAKRVRQEGSESASLPIRMEEV